MKDLLFLAHRIPYPPNKGDKIRSWNILCHLSKRYRVHLGCFVDDPEDWCHLDTVREICGECHFEKLEPAKAKIKSLASLVRREFQLRSIRALWGSAWLVLQPAAQILIYTLIFGRVLGAKLPGVSGQMTYGIYICAGVITWNYFSELVTRSQTLFLDHSDLIWITTEKDALKILPEWVGETGFWVLRIEVEIDEETAVLDRLETQLRESGRLAHDLREESIAASVV